MVLLLLVVTIFVLAGPRQHVHRWISNNTFILIFRKPHPSQNNWFKGEIKNCLWTANTHTNTRQRNWKQRTILIRASTSLPPITKERSTIRTGILKWTIEMHKSFRIVHILVIFISLACQNSASLQHTFLYKLYNVMSTLINPCNPSEWSHKYNITTNPLTIFCNVFKWKTWLVN